MPCLRFVLLAGPSAALQQACESAGQTVPMFSDEHKESRERFSCCFPLKKMTISVNWKKSALVRLKMEILRVIVKISMCNLKTQIWWQWLGVNFNIFRPLTQPADSEKEPPAKSSFYRSCLVWQSDMCDMWHQNQEWSLQAKSLLDSTLS